MMHEEFNTELIRLITPENRSRMLARYSRDTLHHREYALRYNEIATAFMQNKHGMSTVQLAAHLYLESTEFLLSGKRKVFSPRFLQKAMQRVDGVLFLNFLKDEVSWDSVIEVMRIEVKLCRQTSNGDDLTSNRYPVLSIITKLVDNFIADARESMKDDELAEADAEERRQYIESVIMVNRKAHPIPYILRCELLLKTLGSLKKAKALQFYTATQAADFLDMDLSTFLMLFTPNVTPAILDHFYKKTNFRDRRMRARNFLPNVDEPTILAANRGPDRGINSQFSTEKANNYDESIVDSIFRRGQQRKVIHVKFPRKKD